MTVQVAADVAPGTELTNTATVTAKTFDPDTENNTSTATLEVTASADLELTKTINGTAHAGQTVSWTVGVTNLGPSVSAGPFTVTDTLPAGVTDATATGPGWECTTEDGVIECVHAETAAVGAVGSITVTGTLASSATGTLVNEVDVTDTTTPDPTPSHAESSTTIVTATTLAVTKALIAPITPPAETPTIVPGAPATYEVTVTNTGTADAVGVTLTDPLPAGLTFTEAVGVAGTWTCTGTDEVACELDGALVAGATATVRLVVDVPSDLLGPVDNTATAHASNAPDATGSALDPSTPYTNWSIEKTHPAGAVHAGEELIYTLAVMNLGPSDETGVVTVTDTLPTGMTAVSAAGDGWTCDVETTPVTCTYEDGVVAGAELPVIELVVLIASDAGPATLTNSATVTGTLPATDTGRATDTDPTTVTDHSVVTIDKSANPDVVVAGASVEYTLTIGNDGPSDADTLTVTDVLPAGLVATAISGEGWTCTLDTLSCSRATLAPGESTITLTATVLSSVPDGTVLTNVATVGWLDGTVPATDDATADITVAAEADLALTKSPDAERVIAGQTASFTIEVENLGLSDAVGPITVVDTLPEGMSYLGASEAWACAPDGLIVTCALLPSDSGLGAGTVAPDLVLTVQVDAATGPVILTNTATVASPTEDPDPTNNTGSASVEVDQVADLAVVKTHEGPGLIGETLSFDVVVTNNGPSVATGVVVVDTLPSGLAYVSSEGSDEAWTCVAGEPDESGTEVVCALATPLAPDTPAPALVILTEVLPAAYPSVDNVVVVGSDIDDPAPDNDTWTDTVEVDPLVDLTVTKQHIGDLRKGQLGQYRITVHNAGPTEDPGGFTIIDELPVGLEFRGASGEDVTCAVAASVVTCVFDGPLPVDAERSVLLDVAVLTTAPDLIVNEVVVASRYRDLSEDHVGVDRATVLPALPVTGGPALVLLAGLALAALGAGAGVLVGRRGRVDPDSVG